MNTAPSLPIRILRLFTTLILSLALFLLAGTIAISLTFASQGYARSQLKAENYAAQTADELLLRCTSYFSQAGLMQQMLPGIITEEAVEEALLYSLDAAFSGVHTTIDQNEAFAALEVEVIASREENGAPLSDEQKNLLSQVIADCQQSWYAAVTIPKAQLLTSLVYNFRSKLQLPLLAGSCIFAIWPALLLPRLSAGRKESWLYISSAGIGAGLALLGLATTLLFSGWAAGLVPEVLLYHSLVETYATGTLLALALTGAILAALSIGLRFAFGRKDAAQPTRQRPAPPSLKTGTLDM